jgi:hypothetical protein
MDANIEALADLRENLDELRTPLQKLPLVIQYNKRDLPEIEPVDRLREALNPTGAPEVESAAASGVGVSETLQAAAKMVLRKLAA